jgi:hypothetical protein
MSGFVLRGLRFAASLKLTVTLLAMAIFIVFAGTVAQVEKGIWTVVHEYFRTAIAWIDLSIFFPRAWAVPKRVEVFGLCVPLGTYFPGGWLIGGALLANLVAAHAVRFKVQARGRRLAVGLGVVATGVVLAALAITSALDAPSMKVHPAWRIVVQLSHGGGAAVCLLAGCVLLFYRRAGIVLAHAGIILMMTSELFTGLFAVEGQMPIREGESASYVVDGRSTELAVVDRSDPARDLVVAIPESRLRAGAAVRHASMPFEVRVLRWFANSELMEAPAAGGAPATHGDGLGWRAVERAQASGEEQEGASAYVEVRDKETQAFVGTLLVSVHFSQAGRPQTIDFAGRPYELELRFRRTYKPYEVHLVDFRFDRYPGTQEPRNYSSDARIVDAERHVARNVRISMNNPLRYRGDTLYQASFMSDERGTVLQVVTNPAWRVPYAACMIVSIGLLAHFVAMLAWRRSAAGGAP